MDALRAIRVSRLMMAFLKQLGPGCLAETDEPLFRRQAERGQQQGL
jgi:hypothetical protein